jgi:aminopeptidase N
MRLAGLVVVMIVMAASASAQTATPAAGVPLDVAARRAEIITDLRYELDLSIPDKTAAPIAGVTVIRFSLSDASAPLVVDFETSRTHVKSVEANGAAASFGYLSGHIIVPASTLKAGANTIRIAFDAGNDSLNRSQDFLYALFVPARARLAIPCFDQPDLKGRWTLTLRYPARWQAVSNGAEAAAAPAGLDPAIGGPGDGGPFKTTRFAETAPLSTYLFSFVVGDFKVETAQRNGRTFRMFHRETDAAKVARNREAIFDLHARALEFLERYTAIPYAFGKFDFVLIPAFQFGGMEHAGKILYNASGLMLEESATQNQVLGRASVIAHETAHMWFGDLVTMKWFSDVWMKEVFANFMAAKIVNPSFPEVNHDLRFLLAHYPAAYEVDRTEGANPIRQPLDNLNEAGSLYGAIIYQKAPIVMRHLEALLGADNFRDGLREYLKAHAFANATWPDLISVLDRRTPVDLAEWSHVWVEEPGRPTIDTRLVRQGDRLSRLSLEQSDPRKRGRLWPQELQVVIGTPSGPVTRRVNLDRPAVNVPEAQGLQASYVLPNGGGWAYGDIRVDEATLGHLTRSLPDIADPLTRGSAWVTMWDALLNGRVAPRAILDLSLAALPRETDEQLTARVLGYTSAVWWRFLTAAERTAMAPALEAVLRDGLARAGTSSQKASWFGALRGTALTTDTVGWLKRVWEKQEAIAGLTLAEADYTSLARELALREVAGWSAILRAQLDRIENPDRKQRFQFIMPALDAEPAVREQWFLALEDVNNRRREPWVLDGLNDLHHPLRAAESAKYVRPSLDLLWEIQKTGDIFFPKRWLDATLGGHASPAVAETVRGFLQSLPAAYPQRLRNITLQSADELFRAAAMRQ